MIFLLALLPVAARLQAQVTVAQELSIRVEIERQVTAGELVLPPELTLLEAQNTAVGVVRLLLHVAVQPSLGERFLTGTLFWMAIAKAMVVANIGPTPPPPEEPLPPEEEPPPQQAFPVLLGNWSARPLELFL